MCEIGEQGGAGAHRSTSPGVEPVLYTCVLNPAQNLPLSDAPGPAPQGLDRMGSNKGAGRMLVLAALREHGRLREAAIEVIQA